MRRSRSVRTDNRGQLAAGMVSLAAWLLAAAVPAVAQEEPLPSVEQVIDKMIVAMGGRPALERVRNRVSTGNFESPLEGTRVAITIYEAAPDKLLVTMRGQPESGTDGKVCWGIDPGRGAQILSGVQRASMTRSATFNSILHWQRLYPKAECVGREEVDGRPCYVLVMSPAEGEPETWYIDTERMLRIRSQTTYGTGPDRIPIETVFQEFKSVDGIVLPHRVLRRVAMIQNSIIIKRVDHNVELPKDQFDLPPEVQEALAVATGSRPATRAATRGAASKPTARLATRSATQPATRPATQPAVRPTTRPAAPPPRP